MSEANRVMVSFCYSFFRDKSIEICEKYKKRKGENHGLH